MKYSELTEDVKERRRAAVRKWAAKTDRSAYLSEYEKRRNRDPRYIMWSNSKINAKKKNLLHNITIEDIKIPKECPCCLNLIVRPSLDRVDNDLGYQKGNIAVICTTCNSIKRDGDAALHRKIADYIDRH